MSLCFCHEALLFFFFCVSFREMAAGGGCPGEMASRRICHQEEDELTESGRNSYIPRRIGAMSSGQSVIQVP